MMLNGYVNRQYVPKKGMYVMYIQVLMESVIGGCVVDESVLVEAEDITHTTLYERVSEAPAAMLEILRIFKDHIK